MANSTIRTIFYAGVKAVASSATPEPLTSSAILVDSVRIDAATGNAGAILLGVADYISGTTYFHLTPPYVMTAVPGKKLDLSQIFVKVATNGDGATYLALN